MHVRSSVSLPALIAMMAVCLPVSAEVIGVGLDWREKVFVQEFWKEGKAYYALFNDSPQGVSVSVFPRKGGAVLAGPWKLESKGFLEVEVSSLTGKGLIEFKLEGGKSLGLLDAPTEPAAGKEKKPVANVGLNGSGGRQANLWTEQDAVSFSAGGKVELRLSLPTGAGVLMYDAAKLPGIELSSETLDIQREGDKIKIDLSKPKAAKDRHTLVLRFPTPPAAEEKPQPSLIVVDGWLSTPGGGGHGVTRGVIVVPAKK